MTRKEKLEEACNKMQGRAEECQECSEDSGEYCIDCSNRIEPKEVNDLITEFLAYMGGQ